MSSVLRLPFDQYQRYRLVSDLLDRMRVGKTPLRVLDVGGRTALLRKFLKKDEVTIVDLEPSKEKGLVLGSGAQLPFKTETFDVVCAFDTLEHIPVDLRTNFVQECWRVTKSWSILAGPYDHPKARRAENLLRRFLRDKLRLKHRYLEEHREYGLPDRTSVEAQMRELGGQVASVGHANIERWLGTMALGMYLDDDPGLRGMASSLYEFYNKNLYMSDHAEPVYRHAVIGAFNGAPLPDLEGLLSPPVAPKGAAEGLNEVLRATIAFDQERTRWRSEREKFESSVDTLSKDLDGHREALGEVGADAEARKETMKTLRADLAEHRRVVRELKKESGAQQREINRRDKQRKAELAEIAKVRKELEGVRAESAYRAECEEAERASRSALENDLKEHRKVLKDLQSEEDALRKEREKLLEEVKTARRHADEIGQSLGSTQKAGDQAVTALQNDLGEHRKALITLQKEEAALRKEHEKLVAESQSATTELERLRSELEKERSAASKVSKTLSKDLKEHKKVLASTQKELVNKTLYADELAAQVAKLQEDSQQSVEAVTRDLEGHRGSLEETSTELANMRRERDKLLGEMGAVRAEQGRLESLLGSERIKASESIDELKKRIRELESAGTPADGQEAQLLATKRALKEHKQQLAELNERDRQQAEVIETLSADLDGHRKTVEQLLTELRQARGEGEPA